MTYGKDAVIDPVEDHEFMYKPVRTIRLASTYVTGDDRIRRQLQESSTDSFASPSWRTFGRIRRDASRRKSQCKFRARDQSGRDTTIRAPSARPTCLHWYTRRARSVGTCVTCDIIYFPFHDRVVCARTLYTLGGVRRYGYFRPGVV